MKEVLAIDENAFFDMISQIEDIVESTDIPDIKTKTKKAQEFYEKWGVSTEYSINEEIHSKVLEQFEIGLNHILFMAEIAKSLAVNATEAMRIVGENLVDMDETTHITIMPLEDKYLPKE